METADRLLNASWWFGTSRMNVLHGAFGIPLALIVLIFINFVRFRCLFLTVFPQAYNEAVSFT